MCLLVEYMACSDFLLARTLNARGIKFANIRENQVLVNISELTVSVSEKAAKHHILCFKMRSQPVPLN